jgi:methionyl-tRNA formyltransferase
MRLGFYGTPDVAADYLRALAGRHEVVAVVTQPDRPKGRTGQPQPSAVKQVALSLGLPVVQPEPGHCPAACREMDATGKDLCVVVAFGQRLPCGLCGCLNGRAINVHYSLLPKLRGAAPVQHAILQGLETTGVTIQYVAQGWDEGDVVLQRETAVLPDDTCGTLTERLTHIGVDGLLEALDLMASGHAHPVAQDNAQATFAPPIRKADGTIHWCEPAEVIARRVRAFDPWPGATTRAHSKGLRILRARADTAVAGGVHLPGTVLEVDPNAGFAVCCGEGVLRVVQVQPEGKRPMAAAEYLRGARLAVGEQLG